jgi:hypothetical protein
MTDIVERLRSWQKHYAPANSIDIDVLTREAAAEIELLRAQHELALQVHNKMADEIERLRKLRSVEEKHVETIRNDALEEAAKVVDAMPLADLGEEIAAALRALKGEAAAAVDDLRSTWDNP